MADTLDVTRTHLLREIAVKLGLPRTPSSWSASETMDIEAVLKDGLRDFYYAVDPTTGRMHRWSFLYPHSTITTSGPYTTGTITVVAGVVTLAGVGAVFPSWTANGEMLIDGCAYDVSVRTDDTHCTLLDTTVAADAGTTYTLRRCRYDMPSDFAAIKGSISYGPQNTGMVRELYRVDEGTIRDMRQNPGVTTWPPQWYAIVPKEPDRTAAQAWQMWVWPPADDTYILWYTYERSPYTLDSTYDYPLGGAPHARTIMYACLAAAEVKMEDEPGIYSQRFQESLIASIKYDQQMSAPDFHTTHTYPADIATIANRTGLWTGEINYFE